MSDPLGLSIGTTNLVAVRVGNRPVTRRSVLALPDGVVMAGFVERVGDPVPLVAPNGSPHAADRLLVEALAELIDSGGGARSANVTVAVPAHWGPSPQRALRDAMRGHPIFEADGTSVRLVSDAVASLTALQDSPDFPAQGVLALVDFGGGGTSITLADAGRAFEPIDETTRHTEFSGESVDQALLGHILDGLAMSGQADAASTAAVESLARLREKCRDAKERLSTEQATDVDVQLPGYRAVIPVTRGELESVIATPLAGVLAALDTTLRRNAIEWPDIAVVVVVGGGAGIPLIRQRLAEHSGLPVIPAPQPGAAAALGAALIGRDISAAEAPTGLAPVPPVEAGAAVEGEASATFRALAWSQDDVADEPMPYTASGPYEAPYDTGSLRAPVQYVAPVGPIDEPRAWQRLPGLVFGIAAAVAVVAVGGVAIALTSATDGSGVTEAPRTSPAPPPVETVASSAPPPPPATSEAPPPPPVTTVVVTTRPTTTTTTTMVTTTTTATTTPTTTTTTTTRTTTSTPTTTTPTTTTPTTTTATPTTTTTYLTVPFVPVPIPIQVPQNPYQPVP